MKCDFVSVKCSRKVSDLATRIEVEDVGGTFAVSIFVGGAIPTVVLRMSAGDVLRMLDALNAVTGFGRAAINGPARVAAARCPDEEVNLGG